MPIFDQSYRHYEGKIKGYSFRWWIITKKGIMHFLRRKWFLLLLLLTLIPFLVRGIMIYVATHFPQATKVELLDINPKFFFEFILQQHFFMLIMTLIVGSGLIANDLRYNALQLYLSKPIRRVDYIAGKLGIISFFLALVTLVPALFLFLIRLLFSEDISFLKEYYWLPLSIIALSLIIIIVTGCLMLAISSLFKSPRLAAIIFAIIYIFSSAMFQILNRVYRSTSFAVVSYIHNLDRMGTMLFNVRLRYNYNFHWGWSLLVLVGIMFLSFHILNKKVRGVEVAK